MRKLSFTFSIVILLGGILAALAIPAMADDDPPGRVARLNYIQGSVSFKPGGEDEWVQANPNRPLTVGDNLWTDQNARGELHIGSTAIRIANQTGITFLGLDDRTVQIQLAEGALNIHVRRLEGGDAFEIDTPNLAFTIERPGEYRVDVDPEGYTTVVTVREGEGEVTGGGNEYQLDSGDQDTFSGTESLTFDGRYAGRPDEFDEWCRARDEREEHALAARYVSRDVIGYDDLDDYGDWRNVPDYGTVWFPTGVGPGWAPYRLGHWTWIEPWGWTWVEDEPWGFAPFHYGRWALVGGGWCWVPGPVVVRPVYAPALVAFIGGPRFGLSLSIGGGAGVGWFPLGPREVYVPPYHVSERYVQRVNITNTTVNAVNVTNVYNNVNVRNITYMHQNNVAALTAVSRDTFVNARPVGAAAIHVKPEQLRDVQVQRGISVAPVRQSIVGPNAPAKARPPDAVVNRQVVVKQAPAPPPVPYQTKQKILMAQPGRPLSPQQSEQLRTQPAQQTPTGRNVPPAAMQNAPQGGGRGAVPPQPMGGNAPSAQPPATQQGRGTIEMQGNPPRGPQVQQQPPAASNAPQQGRGQIQPPAQPQQGRAPIEMQGNPPRGPQVQQQPPAASNAPQQGRGQGQTPSQPQQGRAATPVPQPPVKFAPPAKVNENTYHPHPVERPQSAAPQPPRQEQQRAPERGPERGGEQRGQDSGRQGGGEQDRKQGR